MATNIKLKRSASAGAIPGTSDVALGELALNTTDGKLYMKKSVSGSESIVEISGTKAATSSAFSHQEFKYTASSNQTTFSGNDANSVSLSYTVNQIQVFLNGILLDATDFTATNGTSVVLASGASSGDILQISAFGGTNPIDTFKYVAGSDGVTSFSGNDANSNSLVYTVGNIVVYLNGVLLDASDFTATTGTSVVLASGASSGDILVIVEYNVAGLTDLADDTTPQLTGDLDVNGQDIVSTSNAHIDIIPHGTGNVNLGTDTVLIGSSGENITVTTNGTGDLTFNTNEGTNSGSIVIADGANGDISITPNGTGILGIDGGSTNGVAIEQGSIKIKNGGAESFIDFYCESSNAHYTRLQAPAHSAFSGNITATLPATTGTIALTSSNITGNAATATALQNARTIHGVSFDGTANIDLSEVVQDTVGAMFSSNTETGIAATYQDSDGTIDLVIGSDVIVNSMIADDAIDSAQLADGSIDTVHIANDQVTGDKLSNDVTIANDLTITNDLTVSGNLVVTGSTTQTGSTVSNSNFQSLSNNNSGNATDFGFFGKFVESSTTKYAGLFFDASTDNTFRLFTDTQTEPGSTVNTGATGYAEATLFANLSTASDMTIDAGGDITLDADGGDILFKDGGTQIGSITNSSNDLVITSAVSNGDIIFKGNDDGSANTTALTLDMSAGGSATFAAKVTVNQNAVGTLTTANTGSFSMAASNNFKCTPSGNFTLTFTNIVSQSGNILLVNSGGHTVSAHSNTKVDANLLATVSTAGTYLLSYFSDGTDVFMTNSAVYT